MRFVLLGQPCAKGNSRRILRAGRGPTARPFLAKSAEANAMVKDYVMQLRAQRRGAPTLTGPVRLVATIYYGSRRPDLDESLVMDALEEAGVIANDRQIEEKVIAKRIDKDNPRTECEVVALHAENARLFA